MIAKLVFGDTEYSIDLDKPLDLSIPMQSGDQNPNAWYVGSPEFKPVQLDDWEGSVASGAAVNFTKMEIIPHAHGTHRMPWPYYCSAEQCEFRLSSLFF